MRGKAGHRERGCDGVRGGKRVGIQAAARRKKGLSLVVVGKGGGRKPMRRAPSAVGGRQSFRSPTAAEG